MVILWCFTVYGFYLANAESKLNNTGFYAILVIMALFLLFLLFFIYYSNVFLISFSLGMHLFQKNKVSKQDYLVVEDDFLEEKKKR